MTGPTGATLHHRIPSWTILALLVLAAFAVRAWQFGNPLIQSDEQFYLLVGQRMWEGAWPYVDLWDRKPVGLFLLYALFAPPGSGVYGYQIAATLFAAATAYGIVLICRPLVSRRAALCAGLLYLPSLNLLQGSGGQSPVFYNLFMVLAALCTIRALAQADGGRGFRLGALAMLLAGVAIQIKYSAVFEGFFFGLALMWWLWRRKVPLAAFALGSAAWALLALLPTLAALAVYALAGYGYDFVFANFISIFERGEAGIGHTALRLLEMAAFLLPILAAAIGGILAARRRHGFHRVAFQACWLVASLAGVLAMGDFYDHYALPILVPAAVNAAAVFDEERGLRGLGWFAILFALVVGGIRMAGGWQRNGDAHDLAPFIRTIGRDPVGCLFVYQGPSSLYSLTRSCLVTRYIYPSHLSHVKERGAIGIDQTRELDRIMLRPPGFVLVEAARDKENERRSRREIAGELAEHYRPVLRARIGRDAYVLYARRKAAPPQGAVDAAGAKH